MIQLHQWRIAFILTGVVFSAVSGAEALVMVPVPLD